MYRMGVPQLENAVSHVPTAPAGTVVASAAAPFAHVLVVDDSEANRRFAAFVLKKFGCAVGTVTDGDEVLRAVSAAAASGHAYDLVLMDLVMVRASVMARAMPHCPVSSEMC